MYATRLRKPVVRSVTVQGQQEIKLIVTLAPEGVFIRDTHTKALFGPLSYKNLYKRCAIATTLEQIGLRRSRRIKATSSGA